MASARLDGADGSRVNKLDLVVVEIKFFRFLMQNYGSF